jgi:hypothetical protein
MLEDSSRVGMNCTQSQATNREAKLKTCASRTLVIQFYFDRLRRADLAVVGRLPLFRRLVFGFRQLRSDGCTYLRGIELVPRCGVGKIRSFLKRLPRIVTGAIQVGYKSADNEELLRSRILK